MRTSESRWKSSGYFSTHCFLNTMNSDILLFWHTVFNIPYFSTEVLDFGCSDAVFMLVFLNAYELLLPAPFSRGLCLYSCAEPAIMLCIGYSANNKQNICLYFKALSV